MQNGTSDLIGTVATGDGADAGVRNILPLTTHSICGYNEQFQNSVNPTSSVPSPQIISGKKYVTSRNPVCM